MNEEKEPTQCHFCGTWVLDGIEADGPRPRRRHWLSDCRPDLVEHEIGPTCTWYSVPGYEPPNNCYAYRDDNLHWQPTHKYFFADGPMG